MAATPSDTDALPNGPLDERAVHVCVDMQNHFARDTALAHALERLEALGRDDGGAARGRDRRQDRLFALMEPGLEQALRARRTETLVITGGETDVCVLATVLAAVDRGYRTVLATDAVCSSSDETHDAMMTPYRQRFGQQREVATTDQILHNWNDSQLPA